MVFRPDQTTGRHNVLLHFPDRGLATTHTNKYQHGHSWFSGCLHISHYQSIKYYFKSPRVSKQQRNLITRRLASDTNKYILMLSTVIIKAVHESFGRSPKIEKY